MPVKWKTKILYSHCNLKYYFSLHVKGWVLYCIVDVEDDWTILIHMSYEILHSWNVVLIY